MHSRSGGGGAAGEQVGPFIFFSVIEDNEPVRSACRYFSLGEERGWKQWTVQKKALISMAIIVLCGWSCVMADARVSSSCWRTSIIYTVLPILACFPYNPYDSGPFGESAYKKIYGSDGGSGGCPDEETVDVFFGRRFMMLKILLLFSLSTILIFVVFEDICLNRARELRDAKREFIYSLG